MEDIIVQGLCKSFDGAAALRNFSARFPAGRITCVMGRSGCGKTTLLNILMGFLSADAGTVAGVPARLAAVFQEDRLLEPFSAAYNLAFVRPKASPALIGEHLAAVGLAQAASQPVRELSGGMRRRVAIARAVLAGGELLILDEPFKGLDEATRRAVASYLRRYTARATVILVTHDEDEVGLMDGGLIRMEPPCA